MSVNALRKEQGIVPREGVAVRSQFFSCFSDGSEARRDPLATRADWTPKGVQDQNASHTSIVGPNLYSFSFRFLEFLPSGLLSKCKYLWEG